MIKSKYICPNCNRQFGRKETLTNHTEKKICIKRNKTKTCEKCGKVFSTKQRYLYHLENVDCENSTNTQKLLDEIRDLKNAMSKIQINNTNQTQNVENQTNNYIENQTINITIINYGNEGSISELIEKFSTEIREIATNDISNFVPLISKTIHDGNKYPKLKNIYSTKSYPNNVMIYKDGQFIKANKLKIYQDMIDRNKEILSQSEGCGLDENNLDQCFDYLDLIEGDQDFRKKTIHDLDQVFLDIGKDIKNHKR